jgi:hypothetical protein
MSIHRLVQGNGLRPCRVAILIGLATAIVLLWSNPWLSGIGPLRLVYTGSEGAAAELVASDFGMEANDLPPDWGHDGQYLYVIARSPLDRDVLTAYLDNPTYRMQRPLMPLLARLLSPVGEGMGLVVSLVAVSFTATALLAVATARLAARFGADPAIAGLVPLLPGVWWSMRLTLTDTLAAALMMLAVTASLNGRRRSAVALAIATVLTKEVMIVAFVGLWLWRRDRPRLIMLASSIAAAGALHVTVSAWLSAPAQEVGALDRPLVGLWSAVLAWRTNLEVGAAICVLGTIALTIFCLVRRRNNPFTWIAAAHLPLIGVLDFVVLELSVNATRAVLPATLAAGLAAASLPDGISPDGDFLQRHRLAFRRLGAGRASSGAMKRPV